MKLEGRLKKTITSFREILKQDKQKGDSYLLEESQNHRNFCFLEMLNCVLIFLKGYIFILYLILF